MRTLFYVVLIAASAFGQNATHPVPVDSGNANLLGQRIGTDDLLSISVYDAPEFSRTVRVGMDGEISLPLMKRTIPVAGLMPREVEAKIAAALRNEDLLKEPIVTVTVAEYGSRPITVTGAVRSPTTFQAIGSVHLSDAITRAGGLTPEAGPEAIIRSTAVGNNGLSRRVVLKPLLDGSDLSQDILLDGGEEVRIPPIPPVGKIFVLGNVKTSGAFPVSDKIDATVLAVLTLAGGLVSSAPKEAYIVRNDDGTQGKHEIPIPFKDIFNRKSPDVQLMAHDILYIPTSKKHEAMVTIEKILQMATSAVIITTETR